MLLDPETELKVFQNARKLLSESWIQGEYGRIDDEPISSTDDLINATCFCSLGAVRRAAMDLDLDVAGVYLERGVVHQFLQTPLFQNHFIAGNRFSVADWNDSPDRTQDQVLAKFDEVIKFLSTKISS